YKVTPYSRNASLKRGKSLSLGFKVYNGNTNYIEKHFEQVLTCEATHKFYLRGTGRLTLPHAVTSEIRRSVDGVHETLNSGSAPERRRRGRAGLGEGAHPLN